MHSITATELPRVLKCGGSLSLPSKNPFPRENKAKEEGIAAHWLVEQVVKHGLSVDELIDRPSPNDVYIDADMVDNIEPYLKECAGAEIEKDVSFSIAGVNIRARADCVKLGEEWLTISDLKYGWRIVEPAENWTMLAYAIGASPRPMPTVLKIFQPRPYHKDGAIRFVSLTSQEIEALTRELEERLNEQLKHPRLQTGSHCHNCNKIYDCPAAREAGYNIVDLSTDVFIDSMTDEGISKLLDQLTRASEHINDLLDAYKDEASARVKNGKIIDNYFMEHTNSKLVWKDKITPDFIKMISGREDVVKETLITPKQAEKLGIKIDNLSERRESGLKLVRRDANKRAAKAFEQLK